MVDYSRRRFLKLATRAAATAFFAGCAGLPVKPFQLFTKSGKPIKFYFDLGAHTTAEDAYRLDPILRDFKPHVVCLEVAGATPTKARLVERIYSEDNPKEKQILDERNKALHDVIRRYRPFIHVLERFSEDEAKKAKERKFGMTENSKWSEFLFFNGAHDDALDTHQKYLDMWAAENVERERRIKEALFKLPEDLEQKYPQLKNEKELRIVVNYGDLHTPISHFASRLGSVKRNLASPHYFLPTEVYVRLHTLGLSHKVTRDHVARALVGGFLSALAMQREVNHANSAAFANLVVRNLTVDQYRRISRETAKYQHRGMEKIDAFRKAVEQEGLVFPASKAQVHSYLQKKRIPLARE